MSDKLTVRNLRFRYKDHEIFDDLTFSLKSGETVALIGPSGCGKSTLLNLLMGVIRRDSGEILVDGQTVESGSEYFAYMPQDDLLLPWLTVLQNVCLYGSIHRQSKQAQNRALELFPRFGLSAYEHAYPSRLSGGMRQRAAFLRTALCGREILLLDEPFGALDVITRSDMQDWLSSMRSSLSQTVLLVTHDVEEAIFLSDRIYVIGGHPAGIAEEFVVKERERSREWLAGQSELRVRIQHAVKALAS